MKIGVHFNCQNDGIAASLRALLPDADIVNFHSDANLPAPIQAERAAILNECDHIIITHADARHGLLSMDALQRSARRCHVLPGFGFAGYHPDMVYVRADGQTISSATGGYHSRIAVAGYLAGLDARDTASLYNGLVFARLGYYAVFEEQVALMSGLWAQDGIEAEPLMRRWAEAGCFAYSINHPKMIVLLDIARIACARMGIEPANPDVDPATLEDRLGRGPMHPLFPEIAAALGVAPEGSFTAGSLHDTPVPLTPVQFVSECFGRYTALPPQALLATQGVAEAMAALALTRRLVPPRRLGASMVLMTHHGTLLRQGPRRGELSHEAVEIPDWQVAHLRLDCDRLPARQAGAGVQGADILPSGDRRHVMIRREGAFLCAEALSSAGFIRPAAGPWEHFLPLSDAELALLHRLTGTDWFNENTQDVITRDQVSLEAGPALRFGAWRIDLTRHFPVQVEEEVRLVLDGALHVVREHVPPAAAPAALPEPGRALGLVGAPVFVSPPMVADAADLDWMRRSAVAAQALDGAPQATQALLRREADPTALGVDGQLSALTVRFCGPGAQSAAGWGEAAARLHVLAAVTPSGATFLVPPHLPPEALGAWRALGFAALNFRPAEPGEAIADLLWLDNASIAELPAEALSGCRARIGIQPETGHKLFWQTGVLAEMGALLAARGFDAVDTTALPPIAGVALAAGAGWIIGRTGQMPLVFCQAGTRVIELCDKAGFVQDDWVLSAKLGLRHAILPCATVNGVLVPDPDKLMRLLGLMADMP